MTDHKQRLARRRARNRIASVDQFATATADGAHDDAGARRAPPSRQPGWIVPVVIISMVAVLALLALLALLATLWRAL